MINQKWGAKLSSSLKLISPFQWGILIISFLSVLIVAAFLASLIEELDFFNRTVKDMACTYKLSVGLIC